MLQLRSKQTLDHGDRGWLTFPEMPSIELELMQRSDPSLGAGEGVLFSDVSALANAFTSATGRRIRELLMMPERVKASLS
jgi:nicotinate dehydrogenase subunit B